MLVSSFSNAYRSTLTMAKMSVGESTAGALALLDVKRSSAAASAKSVTLGMLALSERGGTLGLERGQQQIGRQTLLWLIIRTILDEKGSMSTRRATRALIIAR